MRFKINSFKSKINLLILVLLLSYSCKNKEVISAPKVVSESIIPAPVSIAKTNGLCVISSASRLVISDSISTTKDSFIELINLQAKTLLGYSFDTNSLDSSIIEINLGDETENIPQEGYKTTITEKGVLIEANSNSGAFYGLQSLLQLLVIHQDETTLKSNIPTGIITDSPRYGYRGFMLDVARSFFKGC